MKKMVLSLALGGVLGSAWAAPAYLRFPSVRGDQLVFTAEGDLWKTSLQGGQAQRLTTHPAAETQSAISFDKKWVAFVAAYEGSSEAYVMPAQGGVPKRITFENEVVNVLGWTPEGEVLVSTLNSTGPNAHRIIAAVNPQTMKRRVFPVADANEAVLDDSGRYLYFTRFGLQMTNDNVREYRGGAMASIWRFDLKAKEEAKRLFSGEEWNHRRPMFYNGKLYFTADKDGVFNLWVAEADGTQAKALTSHKDWEVRNAAQGDGKIVYQLGADLHVYDIASGNDTTPSVELVSDFDQQRGQLIRNPLEFLTDSEIASRSDKIVITAHGHIAIAGPGSQRRINIPLPAGSRARSAIFSADDKWVFAFVDTSGENEIWRFPANGIGKAEMLTSDGQFHRENMFPSPDGKHLAHTDKLGRLWLLDLQTRQNKVIDDAGKLGQRGHNGIVWSADSKTLAIVRSDNAMQRSQIGLYSLDSHKLQFITSDRFDSHGPAFSADGQWLYFLSERNFQVSNGSPWGDRNMGPAFGKRTGVFAIALKAGARFPFKADDELSKTPAKPEEKPAEKPADKPASGADLGNDKPSDKPADKPADKAADKPAEKTAAKTDDKAAAPAAAPRAPAIDWAGIEQRLYQVPVPAGNYRSLSTDDKRLYLVDFDNVPMVKTVAFSRTGATVEVFAGNVQSFDLSLDRKRVVFRTVSSTGPGDFYVVDAGAKAPPDTAKAKVALNDWSFRVDPKSEWKQMFNDAWRMHRDYLFDANMRGMDWKKIRSKYEPLVDRITDRHELNDLLSMMMAEVSTLHSQFRPGETRRAASEGTPATLGAVLSRVQGGVRVDHIYRSEPDLPNERAPLAQPDVDVKEGDVILAVNGQPVSEARDISDLLLNQADKQVLLHVRRGNRAPHAVIVHPISMPKNADLRYADWEQTMAAKVNQASGGKIGYLHLRAMGAQDINAFAREFYANYNREGLIIDVRRNRGGNIDSWIIEKLLRKTWAFWSKKGVAPYTNMQQTFRGHLIVLVDELTYSDGETFAAGIKALKLAPLVGKRTAGAGVWLSDGNRLTDGGQIRAAETAQFGMDGQWLVEGVGVAPDVEVENMPNATFEGRDQQLETAIRMLMEKMKEQPVKPLIPQPIPPRSTAQK